MDGVGWADGRRNSSEDWLPLCALSPFSDNLDIILCRRPALLGFSFSTKLIVGPEGGWKASGGPSLRKSSSSRPALDSLGAGVVAGARFTGGRGVEPGGPSSRKDISSRVVVETLGVRRVPAGVLGGDCIWGASSAMSSSSEPFITASRSSDSRLTCLRRVLLGKGLESKACGGPPMGGCTLFGCAAYIGTGGVGGFGWGGPVLDGLRSRRGALDEERLRAVRDEVRLRVGVVGVSLGGELSSSSMMESTWRSVWRRSRDAGGSSGSGWERGARRSRPFSCCLWIFSGC